MNNRKVVLELFGKNTDAYAIIGNIKREHLLCELMERGLSETGERIAEPFRLRSPMSYFDWVYTITVDGVLAGAAVLQGIDEGDGEVVFTFLLPEYRGQGYGKHLFSHISSLAQSMGYHNVWIRFNRTNEQWENFVKHYGFQKVRGHGKDKKYYVRHQNGNQICIFRWGKLI